MSTLRPTEHQMLMRCAQVIADRATCSRASIGAIIASQGRILSSGYNGAPSGLPHCDHSCKCLVGKPCFCRDLSCTVSVHAEANAIAWAARYGIATAGTTMYCTMSPCVECAKLIINAGITEVYYATPYRLITGITLLTFADIRITRLF